MQPNDVVAAVGPPSQTGSQERLTEALIRTQDRMDALRALIGIPVDSLDDTKALIMMLTEALELTNSDCAVLLTSDETLIVGSDTLATGLQHRMVPADVVDGGPQPIEFPDGTAVVVALHDGDAPAALGFARGSDLRYSTGDLQLIDAVVAATDKLLTLARMYREGIARATIEREHQLASTLAQAVLPAGPPKLAGVELFAKVIPADVAGGDFIAFEVLDGVLWFVVGDVAGKGLPAAIVMTRAVSAARVAFHSHSHDDPAGALAAVSDELHDYLSGVGLFVTLVVGAHRPGSGVVHVCNAGHSPVVSVADGVASPIPPSMPPIGVVRGRTGRNHAVLLGPGSVLVLGSDGLSEQQDPAEALYGYPRFGQQIAALAGLTVDEMGERLIADVIAFAKGAPPSDDRTLVLLKATS
ncbi:PP2C family protein-serine/threonine phosphatase [Nakamurella sp. GG22]